MVPDLLRWQVDAVRNELQRYQEAMDAVRWVLDADRRAAADRRNLLRDLMVLCPPPVVRLRVNVVCR